MLYVQDLSVYDMEKGRGHDSRLFKMTHNLSTASQPGALRHKQKIEDKKLLGRGLVKDVAKSSSLASLLAVAEV